jgi:hypothetical protein
VFARCTRNAARPVGLEYLHDLEHEISADDWHDAMLDGFEAAVRERIRTALKAMAA